MIKPVGTIPTKTKLFCQEYWERVAKSAQNISNKHSVPNHDYLYQVNTNLLRNYRQIPFVSSTVRKTIITSDSEFKLLEPTTEDMVLWRGISAPNYRETNARRVFDQAVRIQKGDLIHMPEYAFASTERKTAELYAPKDKRGIIYEIEVPKGARISHSFNYIFPRYSVFECIGTEIIPNGIFPNKLVKLRYILPEKFFGKS